MEKRVAGAALLKKLFILLDIVGQGPGHATATDLSRQTGWPRPTVYRILSAATADGFLRLDPLTGGYTLGFRFLELAQNVWASGDMVSTASLELRRLRDITGETAHLAVLQGDHMLALGKLEGPHPHQGTQRLGVQKPLYCTSQGKAILAFLPDDEVEALISRIDFQARTIHTITDANILRAQLRIIRQRGYSIDDEEVVIGVRCVGAPVLDASGRPVAAISIGGPTYRITNERVERLGPEVSQVAQDISLLLRNPVSTPMQPEDWPVPHSGHREPALHGVSPSWNDCRQELYWTDRFAPRVHISQSVTQSYSVTAEAAIDAVSHTATHVVAYAGGVGLFRDHSGESHERVVEGLKNLTCLAVNSDGIPFGGSYCELQSRTKIGRIGRNGEIEEQWALAARVEHLAWSKAGDTLYASVPQRGLVYALGLTGGSRILSRISKASGEPYGLAVDADDRLWVALYDGWGLARLSPEGDLDHVIALPVPRPTGIAFGGVPDGMMHVTTARMDLARDVLENAPLSGRVLTVKAPARGYMPPAMAYAPGDL